MASAVQGPAIVVAAAIAANLGWAACAADVAVRQAGGRPDQASGRAFAQDQDSGDNLTPSPDPKAASSRHAATASRNVAKADVGAAVSHGEGPSDNAAVAASENSSQFGVAVRIEDQSGRAMSRFHQALQCAQEGQGQARIVFFGASHVASDLFTGYLRQLLQKRFGEAGPGFLLPAKPWPWYRHWGISIERSRGWNALRVRAYAPKSGRYGLAGVALESQADKYARGVIQTRANGGLLGHASRIELFYMKQPNGGRIVVWIDGKRIERISTASDQNEPGYAMYEVADGHHRVDIRTAPDGRARIFGLAMERDNPGVILDTVGVPGARARDHLLWDDAIFRQHLKRRRPDLVALAYGTNEAGDDDVPIEDYASRLTQAVQRIKETVPEASCLLVGPSDRPEKLEPEGYGPRPRTAEIIAAQRRVARELSCGFFDLVRFMGGPMSMVRWAAAEPRYGSPDHVHLTRRGYERLGQVLYDALLPRNHTRLSENDMHHCRPPLPSDPPVASE